MAHASDLRGKKKERRRHLALLQDGPCTLSGCKSIPPRDDHACNQAKRCAALAHCTAKTRNRARTTTDQHLPTAPTHTSELTALQLRRNLPRRQSATPPPRLRPALPKGSSVTSPPPRPWLNRPPAPCRQEIVLLPARPRLACVSTVEAQPAAWPPPRSAAVQTDGADAVALGRRVGGAMAVGHATSGLALRISLCHRIICRWKRDSPPMPCARGWRVTGHLLNVSARVSRAQSRARGARRT